MKKPKTSEITLIAVMSALATVIYYILPEIPLVPGVEYLKIDFSDIPAVIAQVTIGPFGGVLVEVIKNIIHLFRSTTVGIGEMINVGIGSAIVVSLGGFSRLFSRIFKRDRMSAGVYYSASLCAVAVSIPAGWVLNAVLTPLYFSISGIPITTASVMAGVWGSTALNAVKSALNLLPFYPVYRAVYKAFQKK